MNRIDNLAVDLYFAICDDNTCIFYDERPGNKVACITGLAVGFDASVDAVVLVMLSLK